MGVAGGKGDSGEGGGVEGCPGSVCDGESSESESSDGAAGYYIPDGGKLEVTLKLETRYDVYSLRHVVYVTVFTTGRDLHTHTVCVANFLRILYFVVVPFMHAYIYPPQGAGTAECFASLQLWRHQNSTLRQSQRHGPADRLTVTGCPLHWEGQ